MTHTLGIRHTWPPSPLVALIRHIHGVGFEALGTGAGQWGTKAGHDLLGLVHGGLRVGLRGDLLREVTRFERASGQNLTHAPALMRAWHLDIGEVPARNWNSIVLPDGVTLTGNSGACMAAFRAARRTPDCGQS